MLRQNGKRYESAFLARGGCSVMFMNESQFDVLIQTPPSVEFPPVITPLRRPKGR